MHPPEREEELANLRQRLGRRQGFLSRLVAKLLPARRGPMSSMVMLSPSGGVRIRQEKLAPDGVEFSEDVSPARWVEESLAEFTKVSSLLPAGFPAYAPRVSSVIYEGQRTARAVVYHSRLERAYRAPADAIRVHRKPFDQARVPGSVVGQPPSARLDS